MKELMLDGGWGTTWQDIQMSVDSWLAAGSYNEDQLITLRNDCLRIAGEANKRLWQMKRKNQSGSTSLMSNLIGSERSQSNT